jgi:type IV pilus assembly protein PilV
MANNPEHKDSKANARGFTLIEILVALAIFSIGILAVAKMQMWNVNNNSNSNITTIATMLAREKVEYLKSLDLSDSEMSPGVYFDPNNPIDANGDTGGIFTRSWELTDLDGENTTREIEMHVSWTRQGKSREVELTTITRGNGT